MSCSNFFSRDASRVASRDLMASLECYSCTTLQMIVLSSSLAGVLFDTDEVFPPSTAILKIAIIEDSRKRQTIVERIMLSDLSVTNFRTISNVTCNSLCDFLYPLCLYLQLCFCKLNMNFSLANYYQPITLFHIFVYSTHHCCD